MVESYLPLSSPFSGPPLVEGVVADVGAEPKPDVDAMTQKMIRKGRWDEVVAVVSIVFGAKGVSGLLG